jgi:hypothetical protein
MLGGLGAHSRQEERQMASVDDLWKHVFDDALELAASTGMLLPLIDTQLDKNEELHQPLFFLRHQLAMHLALVVTRLHDKPRDDGRIGATASIEALLRHAHKEGRLSPEMLDHFSTSLKKLRDNFSAQAIDYEELLAFGHSELAHSLHRRSQPSYRIFFHAIWELAHDTFEIVATLERDLDRTGVDPMFLDNRFAIWRDRGRTFWSLWKLTHNLGA